jgi:hypothetical protein
LADTVALPPEDAELGGPDTHPLALAVAANSANPTITRSRRNKFFMTEDRFPLREYSRSHTAKLWGVRRSN